MTTTIRIERDGARADVVLARPEVRNAFNEVVIRELAEAFAALGADPAVRVVVIRGEGKAFCAGADLDWMRRMSSAGREENLRDAGAMAAMFRALGECPKFVIARVHGAALGGGSGLAAAADAAVASADALFGFSETKIGIVPAVISEWVLRRIGTGHARALFPTGERFDAAAALRIGLVAEVAPDAAALDAAVERRVAEALTAGPAAVAAAKRLLREREAWAPLPPEERDRRAAAFIADLRATPEAREGMEAFLGKRKPGWCPP
jgi:methylglutaconyl-CoA hydratase